MCVNVIKNISTGCGSIDKILEGGLLLKEVSLIYGEPETGKTTLAMQCSVNCALQNYKVLFVDCDGTLSGRRLLQIASKKFNQIAEFIILTKPKNFYEQTIVLDQLTEYVTKKFGLVVIDTITSLYRAKIAESSKKTFELNRELNRQMAVLAQIAKIHKIAVLVTSQVRSAFNEPQKDIEPVATRVLKFWADKIIAMKQTENSKIIKAVLEKGLKKNRTLTCHLTIGKTGMQEYLL